MQHAPDKSFFASSMFMHNARSTNLFLYTWRNNLLFYLSRVRRKINAWFEIEIHGVINDSSVRKRDA